jgi:hypothetical protein
VPLADELFLIAHDDTTGRPRLHARAAELGLAGALLGELVLDGRITFHDGRLTVVDRRTPDDALAHLVLDQLIAEPQYRTVRIWLAFLAGESVDAVGQRLERAGQVNRTRRRWGRAVRYVPVDASAAAWPGHRLRLVLLRGEPLAGTDALLAGLVAATGLSSLVLWDAPASSHQYLASLVAALPPPLRDLVAHLEAAVGDAVLSHRT